MIDCVPEITHRVLDRGALLHRISWQHETRLRKNSERLRGRVNDTHQRRGHHIHTVVSFTAEINFSGKKEEFLSRDNQTESDPDDK